MTTTPTRPLRTVGDILRGLTAVLVVLGLLAGIPAALVAVAGNPLPTGLPSLDAITAALMTPDDGTLFLTALEWVAWAGWATFAIAVLVEIPAQVRGLPAPHLPALGMQQQAAGALVAAIAVLVTAPAMIPPPPAHAVVATALPAGHQTSLARPPVQAAPAGTHLVQPGDTLWDISADHLGDPHRYPEIVQATRPIVQPDGHQLTDPDLIYPGWQVHMPATAPQDPAAPATTPAPPSLTAEAPGAAPQGQVEGDDPGRLATPAPDATTTHGTDAPGTVDEVDDAAEIPSAAAAATAAGLGTLTAAGLLVLLASKRSQQQRHRRPGQRLPMPDAPAAATERALRAGQDPLTVAHLDRALRTLGCLAHERGEQLPPLRIARILRDRLELHLTSSATAPEPFTCLEGDDTVWLLDREAALMSGTETDDEPAPYPALAAIGRDMDGGHVLLDLEQVGAIGIRTIDDAPVTAELAALTVELATSTRADDLQITLVGTCPDLPAALGVDRVAHTTDLHRLLTELAAWATSLRTALTAAGLDGPGAARAAHVLPDAWCPRVVLVGTDLTDVQRDRLLALVTSEPRLPLAVVTGGPQPLDEWVLTCRPDDGLATLEPAGLTLRPQTLPAAVYEQMLNVLRTAAAPATTPPAPSRTLDHGAQEPRLQDPDLPPADNAYPPDVAGTGPADPQDHSKADAVPTQPAEATSSTPTIRVLGTVDITGARGELSASSHRARLTEALAFMALHPHEDHFLLDEAIWPGDRVPDSRRNQLISRARRWLGTDDDGASFVPPVHQHGYHLAGRVTTDWEQFRALADGPLSHATTSDLLAALHLVRGQPFAGTNANRYAWADIDRQAMIAAIVDVAHEVAQRADSAGDAATARHAAATGLLAEPGSEALWRDSLRAEWLAGDRRGIEQMADRLTRLSEELGDDFEPETLDLLAELLPRDARGRVHSPASAGGGADGR